MQACKPSSREVEIEEPRGSQPGGLAKSVSSRPMQNCLKECIPKNDAQCYFLASTFLSNPHSRVHLLAHSLSLSEELIERKSTLLASTWRGPCGLCELRKQPAESQRGKRGHQFHSPLRATWVCLEGESHPWEHICSFASCSFSDLSRELRSGYCFKLLVS